MGVAPRRRAFERHCRGVGRGVAILRGRVGERRVDRPPMGRRGPPPGPDSPPMASDASRSRRKRPIPTSSMRWWLSRTPVFFTGVSPRHVRAASGNRSRTPPNVLPVSDGGARAITIWRLPWIPTRSIAVLGGSYAEVDPFPASVWRADVQATGTTWRFANAASIGTHAHADVHVLVVTPDDSDELWCGCDGGVFLNRDPSGTGEFASQQLGHRVPLLQLHRAASHRSPRPVYRAAKTTAPRERRADRSGPTSTTATAATA